MIHSSLNNTIIYKFSILLNRRPFIILYISLRPSVTLGILMSNEIQILNHGVLVNEPLNLIKLCYSNYQIFL